MPPRNVRRRARALSRDRRERTRGHLQTSVRKDIPRGEPPALSDPRRMETLRAFGFGSYASRAYLALLEFGTADARAVSREARIPAPKVYGTLHQLMERGLVRLLVDTPRRYEPIPFEAYLEQERLKHLEEAQRLARLAATVAPLFPVTGKKGAADRGGVSVVRGRPPIARLQRQLASRLTTEMILVPSAGALRRTSALTALLADAAAAGVRASVMLPEGTPLAAFDAFRSLAEVRFLRPFGQAPDTVSMACFDARQIVLTHHVPDDDSAQDGHDVAVHITEEAMARHVHEGLAARWAIAVPDRPAARPRRRKG